MKIRVGQIPYLNCEPFYHGLNREDIEVFPLVPTALTRAAENGEIDTGPVPLADCFRLEEKFKSLGQFCIATLDKSGSTFLFSKVPIEELGGARIGITQESSTSHQLLKVLLTHKYRVEPSEYVVSEQPQEDNDAFLLIGDKALRSRLGVPSFPHLYDLATEWYHWTEMPFVFAKWIIRNDLDPERVTYFENVLYGSLDGGLDQIHRVREPREDLLMRPRDMVEYIRGFRYWAGVEELKAIEKFREYLNTPPLSWS